LGWILANKQDWPEDKPVARHTCNNPACVNPDHIIPGTQYENVHDMIAAGRNILPQWIKGTIRPTLVCPHCGKTAVVSNAKRWHFDNCKVKK
jgi:hypothetical protein